MFTSKQLSKNNPNYIFLSEMILMSINVFSAAVPFDTSLRNWLNVTVAKALCSQCEALSFPGAVFNTTLTSRVSCSSFVGRFSPFNLLFWIFCISMQCLCSFLSLLLINPSFLLVCVADNKYIHHGELVTYI